MVIVGHNVAIGIVLAIAAAAIGTTSKQLIAISAHLKRPCLFHLGASLNIMVGPVVDASAYAFAPQVIVAPFACLDVIFNAMTAPYTLKWQGEKLTKIHLIGTALVSLGAVFTSLFASQENIVYSVRELEEQLFFRPTSLVYLTIEAVTLLSVEWAIRGKLLSPAQRGIALGSIAGMLMGNVFFMKGLIGIIQTTVETGDYTAWLRPTPYILAAAAVFGAVYGHVFMRKGLAEYKGVFMVTIFEGAHITAACLSGCIVMEEMAGAVWWRYVCYWCAVALIVGGMLAINMAAAEAAMDKEEKKTFHIAQSFAAVPQDENDATATKGMGKMVGRPLEDMENLEEANGAQELTFRTSKNGSDSNLHRSGNGKELPESPKAATRA